MGEQKAEPPAVRVEAQVRRTRQLRMLAAVALTNGTAFFGGSIVREPRLAVPELALILLWGTAFVGPFAWAQLTLVRRGAELVTSVEELRQLMEVTSLTFTSALPRLPIGRPRTLRPRFTWQFASILLIDIVGFSSPHRTDANREVVHEAMYEITRRACARAGIPWPHCHLEDRGDGILLVLPLRIPAGNALSPFLLPLAELLQEHNRQATEGTRIQLRAALHTGPVKSLPHGVTGEAIIHTARLIDAPPAKNEQHRTGADLMFIASSLVYETIIKHSLDGLRPASYQKITAQVKESALTGWLCLLGAHRRTLLLHLEDPGPLLQVTVGPETRSPDFRPDGTPGMKIRHAEPGKSSA